MRRAQVISAPDMPSSGRERTDTSNSAGDFRQPLMHDDEESADLLVRSKLLFDAEASAACMGSGGSGGGTGGEWGGGGGGGAHTALFGGTPTRGGVRGFAPNFKPPELLNSPL